VMTNAVAVTTFPDRATSLNPKPLTKP
jgi:hypothetical protein